MAENSIQNNPFYQTQIALWGPTGAGKDWLFRSFAKELEYYNQNDHDFHYELGEFQPGDADALLLNAEPPLNIPGTPTNQDIHYLFRRIPLKQDHAHRISAQPHDLIIHNDKSANLVDSLYDQTTFESTYKTLINSQNIILVLGNTSEEAMAGLPQESLSSPSELDKFGSFMDDQSAYLKYLHLLFSALETMPGKNLAVCMTKADQINPKGDPWDILQRRYGSELLRELNIRRKQHHIDVFITSAAGYVKQDDEMIPNYRNGALRDPLRWNPVNTAAPFFWFFEQIERTRLLKENFPSGTDPQDIYIPYPPPRKF